MFRNVTNNHYHIYFHVVGETNKSESLCAGCFSVIGFDFVGNLLVCFMAHERFAGHFFFFFLYLFKQLQELCTFVNISENVASVAILV